MAESLLEMIEEFRRMKLWNVPAVSWTDALAAMHGAFTFGWSDL
jgi:hypothetical protein